MCCLGDSFSSWEERFNCVGSGRDLELCIYYSWTHGIFVPTGKRAVEKDGVNDGEGNEYDLNDSFIEEEEECEPTDEDSDWEPSSEEKDNEDVETLVQETRRFVRIKK